MHFFTIINAVSGYDEYVYDMPYQDDLLVFRVHPRGCFIDV
jgi:hypothetical protein